MAFLKGPGEARNYDGIFKPALVPIVGNLPR